MNDTAMTLYVLVWPVVVAVVLVIICIAFFREWKSAHDEGRDII
ncbi:putative transporter small subunit [Nocardioides alcanivorans]|nr:putative transporter small subunit [Nocardioides alcanivorans]